MLSKDDIQEIADQVVKELGSDYEEKIYQEAFLVELRSRSWDYDRERVLPVFYKKQNVGFCKADIVVRKDSEEVVLELKVGGEDCIKQKIKNELRAYLRAVSDVQDGTTYKGFVVMFPCTPDKKVSKTKIEPPNSATVDEVVLEK